MDNLRITECSHGVLERLLDADERFVMLFHSSSCALMDIQIIIDGWHGMAMCEHSVIGCFT